MKLKYYMRGIGIGIILTTLILTMSNTKEKLTDKEIMKRAAKLGMVMAEDGDKELERVLKDLKPSVTKAADQETEPDASQSQAQEPTEPTKGPTEESPEEPTKGPTEEAPEEPTKGPTEEPTEKPTQGLTEESTQEPTQPPATEPTPTLSPEDLSSEEETISFIIEKGMSSYQVAEVLVRAGLIEDAAEFNRYIINAGKASVIQFGTYALPGETTYEEIVKMIAD